MAASTVCWDLVKPALPAGGMAIRKPRVLYGAGTPAGTIAPWSTEEKGSIFVSTDQTNVAAWIKVAANSAVADWALLSGIQTLATKVYNIDNGAGTADDDVFYFPRAATLLSVVGVYTEATDASGAAEANFKIGSAAAGAEHVGATALVGSKAIGDTQTFALVTGVVAAGGKLFCRHTGIAATEAGQYRVQITYIEQ
ncbi:MAG: hypothetical protein WC935_00265 [Thermoleophilia bacterium]